MSSEPVDSLAAELRKLRRGRGIDSTGIREAVGPELCSACGVTDADGAAEIRRKVRERLIETAGSLPSDLYIAVCAAFALTDEFRQQFYHQRVQQAAIRIERDDRTARRRVDIGVAQLAALLGEQLSRRPGTPAESETDQWHSAVLRTTLNLTFAAPEAIEVRRIVADQDNLREIDLAVTITAPPPGAPAPATGLTMDVLYGGTLVRRSMESAHRYGMALALPVPLDRGQEHEFALRFRIPEGQTMNPHFVCVSQQPCDWLEVRVKFDEKKLPAAVWRLTKVFQNELDDPVHRVDPVTLDNAAELCLSFERPLPGFAYGVQWDMEQG